MLDPQRNKFLLQLLAQLVVGLNVLNKHDPSLSQVVQQLNTVLGDPSSASLQAVSLLVNRAQNIVKGYDLKPANNLSEDPVVNLPTVFYALSQELDHLLTKERLTQQASLSIRAQQLSHKVATFHHKLIK